ncbi:ABC transporter substrate-binding protein [Anaeromicropila populeti]|uniref:Spermidine/putrescine transport system substrate-binding protein n=1 Tax=Anaeromicropila populeti TaxID=37658 RepID=A0A1I6IDB1_9FIRM|nr:spermidine/putrescine ABC transporter substrate-binding protein [Anaeromicropila populeti]SFR64676.1 spermidine/putrescine transport system substrate-binding protein [Anaeromicropila populeti]
MKKKMFRTVLIFTMILAMFAVTGCKSAKKNYKNGELNLYVWTEYVPDSVIKKFEEEYEIKVNVSVFSTNEDMLAKVKSESEGAFDVVLPSDYMVTQMYEQGLLEQLDQSVLTNLSNIGPQYLNQNYDLGNVYSVPYQGGVAAIAVNTTKINTDVTSYADLFKEEFKNSMVVLDDYRAVIGMTARSMGYSMNETDTAVLSEIKDKLLTLKNNIKLYDSDSPKSALISGDCTAAFCWSAEIALAMEENSDIKIVFPSEGAYKFMDNWCIPKGAKNYDNAMKFINYMLGTEPAQMVMEEYPYLNPNTSAVEAMGSEYTKNEAKNPPQEVMKAGEYVLSLDTDTLAVYDKMWTDLKQ